MCSFGLSLRGATLRAGFAIEIGRINDGRHIGEIGERGKSEWSAFLVDSLGPPVRQARAEDFQGGLAAARRRGFTFWVCGLRIDLLGSDWLLAACCLVCLA